MDIEYFAAILSDFLNDSLLEASVSGGELDAIQRTLTIMAGGSQETFDTVLPVLKATGKKFILMRDSGAVQVARAANLIMVAARMAAMGVLLFFSQKAGVDPQKL